MKKRRTGIEPASLAWKARALPLSYRRARSRPFSWCGVDDSLHKLPRTSQSRRARLATVDCEYRWRCRISFPSGGRTRARVDRFRRSRRTGALEGWRRPIPCARPLPGAFVPRPGRCSAVCWPGSAPACRRLGRVGRAERTFAPTPPAPRRAAGRDIPPPIRQNAETPRGVAQSGSALGWGPSGRRFKSCLPDPQTKASGSFGILRPSACPSLGGLGH
jgi:hypothetical protein